MKCQAVFSLAFFIPQVYSNHPSAISHTQKFIFSYSILIENTHKYLIMRIVKELSAKEIRITIFDWNEKYLIKYEIGPLEQTYKISKWDVESEEELMAKIVSVEILSDVELRFDEMGKTLRKISS